jgi:hypothetical protein
MQVNQHSAHESDFDLTGMHGVSRESIEIEPGQRYCCWRYDDAAGISEVFSAIVRSARDAKGQVLITRERDGRKYATGADNVLCLVEDWFGYKLRSIARQYRSYVTGHGQPRSLLMGVSISEIEQTWQHVEQLIQCTSGDPLQARYAQELRDVHERDLARAHGRHVRSWAAPRQASDEGRAARIKRDWRQLAMRLHPDRNPSPDAHERFIAAQQSYERQLRMAGAN